MIASSFYFPYNQNPSSARKQYLKTLVASPLDSPSTTSSENHLLTCSSKLFYLISIPTMKSCIYMLTALLPLASQVAMASPVAEPGDSSLEERGNGWGNRNGNGHDHDHERPEDYCKIQKPYSYHKYPCDSSDIVGQSNVGDNFAPVCKYQYGFFIFQSTCDPQ